MKDVSPPPVLPSPGLLNFGWASTSASIPVDRAKCALLWSHCFPKIVDCQINVRNCKKQILYLIEPLFRWSLRCCSCRWRSKENTKVFEDLVIFEEFLSQCRCCWFAVTVHDASRKMHIVDWIAQYAMWEMEISCGTYETLRCFFVAVTVHKQTFMYCLHNIKPLEMCWGHLWMKASSQGTPRK